MIGYRVPRSMYFRDLFRVNEDHIWRNGHTFQPETSISRPPASCYAEVSLFTVRSHGSKFNAELLNLPVHWFVARPLLYGVLASMSGGSSDRVYPRYPLYWDFNERRKNLSPHPIFHTFFSFERRKLQNIFYFFENR